MKEYFVLVGVIITFVSYVPYFKDIFSGKTKPHAFTWFIWATLTAIAFFAQVADGGGIGATILGLTAFISYFIFFAALKVGRKNIVKVDWIFLAGALLALLVWAITDNPLWSVILVTIIDAVAFAPTFRKAYLDPNSETLITYQLSGIKFVFALAALEAYSVTTVLYPASLVLANALFVVMLVSRRRSVEINIKTKYR
jgi:hypothetical protein